MKRVVIIAALLGLGCGAAAQTGKCSYYGKRYHGRKTASGARFDMHAMTAAHRALPFGTRLLVENLHSGETVEVTVNDRGPFGDKERILDLSRGAAIRLGMLKRGVIRCRLTELNPQEVFQTSSSLRK